MIAGPTNEATISIMKEDTIGQGFEVAFVFEMKCPPNRILFDL